MHISERRRRLVINGEKESLCVCQGGREVLFEFCKTWGNSLCQPWQKSQQKPLEAQYMPFESINAMLAYFNQIFLPE